MDQSGKWSLKVQDLSYYDPQSHSFNWHEAGIIPISVNLRIWHQQLGNWIFFPALYKTILTTDTRSSSVEVLYI